jgi:Delta24-sterol reductase
MPFGNDAWFRYPFGWSLPPKMSLLKGSHTPETREASVRKQVYQDLAFPFAKLAEGVDVATELFDIFPLLCYPCKLRDVPGRMVRSHTGADTAFINLGIYGVPKPLRSGRPFKTVHAVRELEAWIRSVGGFQHSYCDSFQTEEEFGQMFDTALNAKLRKQYGADRAFVGVYEKTRPEVDVMAWMAEEKGWTEN